MTPLRIVGCFGLALTTLMIFLMWCFWLSVVGKVYELDTFSPSQELHLSQYIGTTVPEDTIWRQAKFMANRESVLYVLLNMSSSQCETFKESLRLGAWKKEDSLPKGFPRPVYPVDASGDLDSEWVHAKHRWIKILNKSDGTCDIVFTKGFEFPEGAGAPDSPSDLMSIFSK